MKAAAFSYARPRRLADALALLAEYGDEARLLAGGQTLLATLNMRLSEPSLLIDMQAIGELKGISVQGSTLRIGALVTHSDVESSAVVAQHAPMLSAAAPHIAHRAIRNLGTFGGSIAYGDPAAEWPTCLLALGGTVVARSLQGERRIAVDSFFTGLYTTALVADEIIVACEIPVVQVGQVSHFTELARRHGDYAVVGLAAKADMATGTMRHVRLAWLGVGSTPLRSPAAEAALEGQTLTPAAIEQAVAALSTEIQPLADLTHSEATKRQLACVLLKRTLLGWMPAHV
jgi:carbon-monoxide dehydrogenase medium subunit